MEIRMRLQKEFDPIVQTVMFMHSINYLQVRTWISVRVCTINSTSVDIYHN